MDLSLPLASNVTAAIGGTWSDPVLYSIVGGFILLTLALWVVLRLI